MSRVPTPGAAGGPSARVPNLFPPVPMTEDEQIKAVARNLTRLSNQLAGTLASQFDQLYKLFWTDGKDVRSADFLNKLADTLDATKPGLSGQLVQLAEAISQTLVISGMVQAEDVAPKLPISVDSKTGKFTVGE